MSKDIKDEELYSQLYNIIQSAVRNEVERAMQEKDDKAQHDITQDNKITKASEKQVDSYIIGGETQEDAVTNDFYIDEYEEAVEEEQLIFNKMLEYYTESHRKNKKKNQGRHDMYDCDSSDIPYAYVYNEQFKDCISGILDNFTFCTLYISYCSRVYGL